MKYGDVLGGCWGIFLKTRTPSILQIAKSGFGMENTVAGQYHRQSETASVETDGLRRAYSIPYSMGDVQEIVVLYKNRDKRMLSRRNQLAVRSLKETVYLANRTKPPFLDSTAQPPTTDRPN